MNQTYLQWSVGVLALIVIAAGAYLFWKRTQPSTSTPVAATSTPAVSEGKATTTPATPGYTITQVPVANRPSVPPYKSPLVCSADFSASACASMQSKYAGLIATITKNETDGNAWINLGSLRKMNDDYAGAIAAWSYIAKLYPTNPIAFSNLGDLYMNFLHDYPKAEANYLMAIKNLPADTAYYQTLFTLYTTTSYKPSQSAGEDILNKGIAANPSAIDLPVTLARYYKSLGRTAEAKVQYDAAIANAKAAGKTDLAAEIQAEAGN